MLLKLDHTHKSQDDTEFLNCVIFIPGAANNNYIGLCGKNDVIP